MSTLELRSVAKFYETPSGRLEILRDVNLLVTEGSFITFFGPNGCGKTTLMNIISGLETRDSGSLSLNGIKQGAIAFVFQDYRSSLLPWKTTEENIIFPLLIRGVSKNNALHELRQLMNYLGIELRLNSRIYDLSGGQAQLACILRALIIKPRILILDEPFSALDYHTCIDLRQKLLGIWAQMKFTALFISHDLDEALYLADKAVFLSPRPATIIKSLEVPLPQPRLPQMLGSSEFATIKAEALAIVTEQNASTA